MSTARPRARERARPRTHLRWLRYRLYIFLPSLLIATLIAARAVYAEDAAPRPALWKLEDANSEIWLFGTVHILNPSLKWRTGRVDSAFDSAEVFYSEAPVVQADPEMMQPLIMKYGINRSNTPFTEKLSKQGLADFKTTLRNLGMTEEAMSQFKPYRPWLAGVTIGALQVQKKGGDPDAGVDKILWREAVKEGKMLGYFETMEQQISLFGAMTPEEELKFFEDGLRQLIEAPDLLDDITRDWQAGRVNELAHKLNSAMEGQDSLRDRMMVKRNHAWAEKIAELMEGEGKVFVAVGAGHLAGEGSLQEHLEELGYTVSRLQ